MPTIKELLKKRKLIACPLVYDALSARICEMVGYEVAYISGSSMHASGFALPDVGLLTMTEVLDRTRAIVQAVNIPVVCDVDTGFGGINNIRRMVMEFEAAGVSCVHIDDQAFPPRGSSMPGKGVISVDEFLPKLRAIVETRKSEDFLILARTDCKETMGMDEVIRRLNIYADHGADLALGTYHSIEEHKRMAKEVKIPLVASAGLNDIDITLEEWEAFGVRMLEVFHVPYLASIKAIKKSMTLLKTKGTVAEMKDEFATREELKEILAIDEWLKHAEKWS